MGASTGALDSHRCRPHRGALTMKARRRARLTARRNQAEFIVGHSSFFL